MKLCCKKSLQTLSKYLKSPCVLHSSAFSDTPFKKSKLAPLQEQNMIDRGGNGCSSFHRSRSDRRGRPDGGNGGRGGDVILDSSGTLWDFSSLQHHILGSSSSLFHLPPCMISGFPFSSVSTPNFHVSQNAKRGGHGEPKNMIGTRGNDEVILVPVGTVIHLVEGDIPAIAEKASSEPLDPGIFLVH